MSIVLLNQNKTFSYVVDASNNWSTSAAWTLPIGKLYPDGGNNIVNLINSITTARTVTIDVPVCLNSLSVGSSAAFLFTLAASGSGILIFTDFKTPSGAVFNNSRSNSYSCPMRFDVPVTIDSNGSSGGDFTCTGSLTGNGNMIRTNSFSTVEIARFDNILSTYTGQIIIRQGTISIRGTSNISNSHQTIILGDSNSVSNGLAKTIHLTTGTYAHNFDCTQAAGAASGTVSRPKIICYDGNVTLNGNINFGNSTSAYQNIRIDIGAFDTGTYLTINGVITGSSAGSGFNGTIAIGGSNSNHNGAFVCLTNSSNNWGASQALIVVKGSLLVRGNANSTGVLGTATSSTALQMGDGSAAWTDTVVILIDTGNFTQSKHLQINTVSGSLALSKYTVGINSAHNGIWSGDITTNATAAITYPLELTAPSGGEVNFTGIISKNAATTAINITKVGSGKVKISGINTLSAGSLTVSAGILVVNGSFVSAVTTTVSTTLQGTGTLNGTVVVNTFGTIQPGDDGVGTLNTGALTLNNSTRVIIKTSGASVSSIAVTGNLMLDGVLDLPDSSLNTGTYDIITFTGTLTNNIVTLGTNNTGKTISISTATANKVQIIVT